jgi:hypothetical protein
LLTSVFSIVFFISCLPFASFILFYRHSMSFDISISGFWACW